MRDLPAHDHLAVGQQRRRGGHVQVLGVVRGPVAGREVLQQPHGRRQLEHRVAVVVGVRGRVDRAVADADPDVAAAVHDRRRAAHPDRALRLVGRGVDREDPRPPAGLRGRRSPGPGSWRSRRSSRPCRTPPGRRRGSGRCAAAAPRYRRRPGPRPGSSRSCRWRWPGRPACAPGSRCTSSSATTKISPRAGSMTGVPVMPTVGVMSPQGSDAGGHRAAEMGRPDHRAGGGRQRVHRVVLRGHVDAPGEDQGLAVELAVEGGRGPRPGRWC